MDATTGRNIGRDGYIYFYPLVLMEISRRQMTDTGPGPVRAPCNVFAHNFTFPKGGFKTVVRPNFDTYYSLVWLDLREQPVLISTPTAPARQYYILQALDFWTDVFASITPKNTGLEAGDYAFVGPNWKGELPKGVIRIDSPTNYVWILGRTAASGPQDEAARALQRGYKATLLSYWPNGGPPIPHPKNPSVDFRTPPPKQVEAMSASAFFSLAAQLLVDNPPHVNDWPIMQRLRRAGWQIGAGYGSPLDPAAEAALEAGMKEGKKIIAAGLEKAGVLANGWRTSMDLGTYGADYLKRAATALFGIGANLPEDSLYPTLWTDVDGKALIGENPYLLRFEAGKLPPAGAFWSITLYDWDGYPVPNRLNRYALGDRDQLVYGADGSLDLWVGGSEPNKDRLPNWLPAGDGQFTLLMRVYDPGMEMLDGRWTPPAIRQLTSNKL